MAIIVSPFKIFNHILIVLNKLCDISEGEKKNISKKKIGITIAVHKWILIVYKFIIDTLSIATAKTSPHEKKKH